MSAKKKSVFKAGIWYTISNFLVKGITFLTMPLFTRIMSSDDIGLFSNISSWFNILAIVTTFEIYSSISIARFDYKDNLDEYVSSSLFLSTIITSIFYILVLIFHNFFENLFSMNFITLNLIFIYLLVYTSIQMYQIKNQINYDIQNIKQTKKDEEPKSAKTMSLKQAYDLYKKVIKFQDGIDKISNGNFTDEDSIKTIITSISFIFNLTKNKKQYEKNTFKGMQFVFWQTVIEVGGKYAGFPISADFLQHSLEKEPENLVITEGKVIKEITEDKYFQENINNIVKKYGNDCNEFTFDSKKDDSFPMNFNHKDLYFSIHSANLYIKGKKNTDKWNLEITLHDKYDYSQPKNLIKYYNDTSSISKSLLSSTLYNFASLSVHSGVIKEYDIDIKMTIGKFEVK